MKIKLPENDFDKTILKLINDYNNGKPFFVDGYETYKMDDYWLDLPVNDSIFEENILLRKRIRNEYFTAEIEEIFNTKTKDWFIFNVNITNGSQEDFDSLVLMKILTLEDK